MTRFRILPFTFAPALAALLFTTTPAGCGSEGPAPEPDGPVGTVALPLLTQTNGHTYRLRNPFVLISGPTFTQLFDDDPDETALSATLSTGTYTAFLLNGWTLERDDGTGNFAPVVATLASSSSVGFTIFNGTTSTISFAFQTDGVIVTVGSGALRVTATVDEIGASCTPFGADCSAGAWCPPTTLTGAARACIVGGATPIGAACASPIGCVAGASCFDLGSGPVCAALCPPAQFDQACDGGGLCQAINAEYGVCQPTAPTMP